MPGGGGAARQPRRLAGGGLRLGAGRVLVGLDALLQDDVGAGEHLDGVGQAVCGRRGKERKISVYDMSNFRFSFINNVIL